MMIIGADYHPGFQTIAFLDEETGEYGERDLKHPGEAEAFYRNLKGGQVRVGIEATGHCGWFEALLAELKMELWLGDPATIRSKRVRKQKHDREDARLLLRLLRNGEFPRIWIPDMGNRDLRQLLWHRHRLVQMRTRVQNQLQAIALNAGIRRKKRLWSQAGREQLQALVLPPWSRQRRDDLLQLLDHLEPRIEQLSAEVKREAEQCPAARLLMTHPGVGAITSLALVLILGNPKRFRCANK